MDLSCQKLTQSEPTWLLSYTRLPTHWISSWDEIQWVFCDGSNRTWAPGDNSDYGEELQQQKLDVKYPEHPWTSLDFSV